MDIRKMLFYVFPAEAGIHSRSKYRLASITN